MPSSNLESFLALAPRSKVDVRQVAFQLLTMEYTFEQFE